jgi:cellobiose phosphorylase
MRTASLTASHELGAVGSHQISPHARAGRIAQLDFRAGLLRKSAAEKWEAPGVVNKARAHALLARFKTDAQVGAALAALQAYWEDAARPFPCQTGDESSTAW